MILCFIEVNFGIVCASVPALRPFFSRVIPRVLAGRRKATDSDSSEMDGRLMHTIEQRNLERRNQGRHNMGQELYNMSSSDNSSKGHVSYDEETRLWPPRKPNKFHGFSNVSLTT